MSAVNREDKRQAALFATEAGGSFVGVVLNRPVEMVLSYRVPKRLEGHVQVGSRVRIPLGRGNQPAVGYCVRLDAERTKAYPGLRFAVDNRRVEATVLPLDGIRQAPVSPVDGRPMRRADVAELTSLLDD